MEVPNDEPQSADMRNDRVEQAEQQEANDSENEKMKDEGNGLYLMLSLIVLVIGVVIIVIMLVVVKDDDDDDVGVVLPPTLSPVAVEAVLMTDPQLRLDMILEAVGNNPATAPYLDSQLPDVASELIGIAANDSEDPIKRAASWVVHEDEYYAEHEIVERFALMSVWYTTGGIDWIVRAEWAGSGSICGWFGVSCCHSYFPELDPHSCIGKMGYEVVEVDLHDNNLIGPIPAAISLLQACHSLALGRNELTGELDPLVFSSMPELDQLYVQHNRLSGGIDGSIRDNGQLDTLMTHGNNFTGPWPTEFCPQCVFEKICTKEPLVWTLDCKMMTCSRLCCVTFSSDKINCISERP